MYKRLSVVVSSTDTVKTKKKLNADNPVKTLNM